MARTTPPSTLSAAPVVAKGTPVRGRPTGRRTTGPDAAGENAATGRRLGRPPLMFETSVPGVFAVGDVRAQSVKRVASAVGEGSVVIQQVHQYLEGSPARMASG